VMFSGGGDASSRRGWLPVHQTRSWQPDFDDMPPRVGVNQPLQSTIFTAETPMPLSNDTFRAGVSITIGSKRHGCQFRSVMTCEAQLSFGYGGSRRCRFFRRGEGSRYLREKRITDETGGSALTIGSHATAARDRGAGRHQAHRRADTVLARHECRGLSATFGDNRP